VLGRGRCSSTVGVFTRWQRIGRQVLDQYMVDGVLRRTSLEALKGGSGYVFGTALSIVAVSYAQSSLLV
jgi:hypothetical protein